MIYSALTLILLYAALSASQESLADPDDKGGHLRRLAATTGAAVTVNVKAGTTTSSDRSGQRTDSSTVSDGGDGGTADNSYGDSADNSYGDSVNQYDSSTGGDGGIADAEYGDSSSQYDSSTSDGLAANAVDTYATNDYASGVNSGYDTSAYNAANGANDMYGTYADSSGYTNGIAGNGYSGSSLGYGNSVNGINGNGADVYNNGGDGGVYYYGPGNPAQRGNIGPYNIKNYNFRNPITNFPRGAFHDIAITRAGPGNPASFVYDPIVVGFSGGGRNSFQTGTISVYMARDRTSLIWTRVNSPAFLSSSLLTPGSAAATGGIAGVATASALGYNSGIRQTDAGYTDDVNGYNGNGNDLGANGNSFSSGGTLGYNSGLGFNGDGNGNIIDANGNVIDNIDSSLSYGGNVIDSNGNVMGGAGIGGGIGAGMGAGMGAGLGGRIGGGMGAGVGAGLTTRIFNGNTEVGRYLNGEWQSQQQILNEQNGQIDPVTGEGLNPGQQLGGQLYSVARYTTTIITAGRDAAGNQLVIRSRDNGRTWQRTIPYSRLGVLYGTTMRDINVGFVVGTTKPIVQQRSSYYGGSGVLSTPTTAVILRTSNRGNTWSLISNVPSAIANGATVLRGVAAIGNRVITVGFNNFYNTKTVFQVIWVSVNGGSSFTMASAYGSNIVAGMLYDVSMSSPLVAYACGSRGGNTGVNGGNGVILKSITGGATWSVSKISPGGKLFGIYAVTDLYVLAVGVGNQQKSRLWQTIDGGISWTMYRPPLGLSGIDFLFSVVADYTRLLGSAAVNPRSITVVGTTGTSSDGRGQQLVLVGRNTRLAVAGVAGAGMGVAGVGAAGVGVAGVAGVGGVGIVGAGAVGVGGVGFGSGIGTSSYNGNDASGYGTSSYGYNNAGLGSFAAESSDGTYSEDSADGYSDGTADSGLGYSSSDYSGGGDGVDSSASDGGDSADYGATDSYSSEAGSDYEADTASDGADNESDGSDNESGY